MKAGSTARRHRLLLAAGSWLAWLVVPGCSETTNLVGNGAVMPADAGADSGQRDAAVPAPDASSTPTWDDAGVIQCGKHPCACSNALDDDGDDLLDGDDNECIGPADDDELSFATGSERDAERACQDCFFDGNSGAGDGCRRASSCATTGDAQSGTGACNSCDVTPQCTDSCRPLTPNGCDCFGCCEVHLGGGQVVDVMLRAGCALATLSDPDLCQRCTKAPDCENPCEACELCLGKGPADLPSQCAGSPPACGDGEPSCDSQRPCAAGFYCQWGCCLPILL
jgi:hypothetical protein